MADKIDMNKTFRESGLKNFDTIIVTPAMPAPNPDSNGQRQQQTRLTAPEFYWSRYAHSVAIKFKNKNRPNELVCAIEVSRKMTFKALHHWLNMELIELKVLSTKSTCDLYRER